MPMYQLSICYPADAQQPPPAELEQIMVEMNKVGTAMEQSNVWVFGGGLHDVSTATTVREIDGELLLTDGPFIEAKEQIGGITIIEAADLDEAINWARQQSAAAGVPVEVRPFIYGNCRS
ncbi:MAG: YciI family protein [Actinomycetota bacterium]|nr:YciI family protein [Actinomycetota bacterium]